MLAEQAAKRKEDGQRSGGRGNKKTSPKELGEVSHNGEATAQAAKLTGTNRTYVETAKKIKDESPEVFEELKDER